MRRIDVLAIGLAVFLAGGSAFLAFRVLGLDSLDAGVWSQVVLVTGLLAYLGTYLVRALTQRMTYNQQLKDYEDAVLTKRLQEMSPEALVQLQADVAAEHAKQARPDTKPGAS